MEDGEEEEEEVVDCLLMFLICNAIMNDTHTYIFLYTYIYIHTYTEKEKEKVKEKGIFFNVSNCVLSCCDDEVK